MKQISKVLTSFILVLFSLSSYSQSLIPLDQFIKQKNLNDPSEFSYIGQRCSALFSMVSHVLRENGDPSDRDSIKTLENRSSVMRNVSLTLDLGHNKKSMESVMSQSKQFIEIYTKQLARNKQINNNYFDGYIKGDLKICSDIYPTFEELNKKIPK